ncbi:MAG TPA: hypothetical protein VL349_01210 [Terriglobales bacterium]|jgi:hypothetical protein|nr:hypothetical protein [Terriglobales bacterium]
MKKYLLAGVCAFALCALTGASAFAQSSEVKEKPPMYSYVSNWAIPRAQWGEMDKGNAANQKILEKALSSGTLVGYGEDVNLVHEIDGVTHDDWWSSMSMAGVINLLEQFYQTGASTTTVLGTATKHYDHIWVSKFYNWHPGTYKNVYTHVGEYKLKADAPDDAVETLSKTILVPFFEKLLADGTIHEYEVDTQALHTSAPGTFDLVYITANAEGLDKVDAALTESLKANPLIGPAFGSMVDFTAHRDSLARTTATYK